MEMKDIHLVMMRPRPSFGHKVFVKQKLKKAGRSPALDRLLYNESTEAFFWSMQN
jgi:hypothetical protein